MEFRYYISKHWEKFEILEVMEALEFAASFYGLEGITTVRMISNQTETAEATAQKLRSNRFELRVNRKHYQTDNDRIKAVFHEMTHIKQFVEDGLNIEAKRFRNSHYTGTEYWYTPWEMEARAMEEPLLLDFREEF